MTLKAPFLHGGDSGVGAQEVNVFLYDIFIILAGLFNICIVRIKQEKRPTCNSKRYSIILLWSRREIISMLQ